MYTMVQIWQHKQISSESHSFIKRFTSKFCSSSVSVFTKNK
uniref:Uncharacterized protein n=1 Tax=Anguilla anguilla TaxID=7936 RepID=A0A0E9QDU8_ANGAN